MHALARDSFDLPADVVYLDGNSLGPLPRGVHARVEDLIRAQWRNSLIRGWNDHDWMGLPGAVGNRIARLIGAQPDTVMVADSTSINVAKVLNAALDLRRDRRIVLSDSGNFPTDLYMADGLIRTRGGTAELVVVDPTDVIDAIAVHAQDLAVVMLTHVDYRTGRMHDMASVTTATHDIGAIAIWDLAHSAGAVPVDLTAVGADFAVGCTYKYLNGGPGSPGFAYAAPGHVDAMEPLLSGWLGHAAPFAFDLDYRPAVGAERLRVGTPAIISMTALDAALDVWDEVSMQDVRAASIELSETFIEAVMAQCGRHDLRLVSPTDPHQRGSQVSYAHPHAYAVMQALIAAGVIGDFREPDIIRFGFTPLYLGTDDIARAVAILAEVLDERHWDDPAFAVKAAVT